MIMKELAINRRLNDSTRKQGVWLPTKDGIMILSLHITEGDNPEIIITDNKDYSKIYCVMSPDYYNAAY